MSELSQHAKLIKAIEIAKGAQVGIELSYFDVLEVAGELNEAKEVVAMLNARIAELEDAQRWIPVSEPPKVSGKYLLLNIYDDVYPCDFIAGTEIWVLPDYDTITHWMPLPKLPEVQE